MRALLAPHARVNAPPRLDLLQADLDKAIIERGNNERNLLQIGTPLLAVEQKRAPVNVQAVGFGATVAKQVNERKGKTGRKRTKSQKVSTPARRLSTLAAALKKSGVVRINGALSPETAAAMRDCIDAERVTALADVAAGRRASRDRFANLVLLDKRCDLLLPLRGPCISALDELLGAKSVLGPLLTELVGSEGMLEEIACLISEPGSQQQPIHPDTPYTSEPTLYAAFVALQDVEPDMGPTVYLPGTHTKECHASFYGGDIDRGKDRNGFRTAPIPQEFLRSRPVVLGTLKAGDVALYNQQVLHCGSANTSPDQTRRQFYVSFRNTAVSFPGHAAIPFSIRPSFKNKLSLGSLQTELRLLDGAASRTAEDGNTGLFGDLDAVDCAH